MAWEVDWSNPKTSGSKVWARNPTGFTRSSKEWKFVTTAYLRKHTKIPLPTYRSDSWEIDWSKRDGKCVWGRNPLSKMPTARDWHWIEHHALDRNGIPWKPKYARTGVYKNKQGYITLTRAGMTEEEIKLAKEHNLFRGVRHLFVHKHRLEAVKKFGSIPVGHVVRHINGIKTDNRPNNLIIGTTQENTMDHSTARLMAMYWHNKYEEVIKILNKYQIKELLQKRENLM